MAISFNAFLWSLTQQESGGRYNAVGVWVRGDRAYGRYQVMGANIPSWTRQYYGRSLTPQQYLNNRAAQDAVVRGRLQGYVNKYGYRGAASAWYSGNPSLHMSTRSQYGGPSIKGYVDQIMNRASGYTGGGGSGGGGGGGYTAGAPVKVVLDRDELAERYGLSSALINSSATLRSLFNKAVSGSWSPARFQAELKNSKWWRSQSSTLRKYLTTRATDPATHRQRWAAAQKQVNQLAVGVGLGNQINSKTRSSKLLRQGIYNKLALGWTDARLKDWFGARATTHGGIMWGEAGDAFDKLHEIAYANGMKYSSAWYKKNAVHVVAGRGTLSRYEDEIRRAAAGKYKAFATQIMAGQNALDLASPYIKATATLLELPETDVDLFTNHIYSAMAGGKAGAQFPLWDFENQLRNDPAWKKTNNARESMMTVARQVAKDFGMAY